MIEIIYDDGCSGMARIFTVETMGATPSSGDFLWLRVDGENIKIPNECDDVVVNHARISELLPRRYDNANRGLYHSRDMIRLPDGAITEFWIIESEANDNFYTEFYAVGYEPDDNLVCTQFKVSDGAATLIHRLTGNGTQSKQRSIGT